MPTYNYRLTGRNIKSLSAEESVERIAQWGSDCIHCGHPGCPFEICAVGGENVMGGAMQEGWTFSREAHQNLITAFEKAGPGAIGIATSALDMNGPWRCALHPTEQHKAITPELLAEMCPGPKHPEYIRGHADGFEQGSKAARMAANNRVAFHGMRLEVPDLDDLVAVFREPGAVQKMAAHIATVHQSWSRSEDLSDSIEKLSKQFNVPSGILSQLLIVGVVVTSNWFNRKYADQIEAGYEGSQVQ